MGECRRRDRSEASCSDFITNTAVTSPLMGELVCAACQEDIQGRAMRARDSCYHEHHFVCSHAGCGVNLVKLPVYTR